LVANATQSSGHSEHVSTIADTGTGRRSAALFLIARPVHIGHRRKVHLNADDTRGDDRLLPGNVQTPRVQVRQRATGRHPESSLRTCPARPPRTYLVSDLLKEPTHQGHAQNARFEVYDTAATTLYAAGMTPTSPCSRLNGIVPPVAGGAVSGFGTDRRRHCLTH
jgi:hypothetical protein